MKTNLYMVKDSISSQVLCGFVACNDGMAVRDNIVALSKAVPLGDLALYCVGTVDTESMFVEYSAPRLVLWDSYKFPENPLKKDIDSVKKGGDAK